jgi:hypothetical protein
MAVTGLFGQVQKLTSTDSVTGRLIVSYLRWVGATTAGHSLVVNDADGNVIWESEADGANFIDILPFWRRVNGVTVNTIDSGNLFIYYL